MLYYIHDSIFYFGCNYLVCKSARGFRYAKKQAITGLFFRGHFQSLITHAYSFLALPDHNYTRPKILVWLPWPRSDQPVLNLCPLNYCSTLIIQATIYQYRIGDAGHAFQCFNCCMVLWIILASVLAIPLCKGFVLHVHLFRREMFDFTFPATPIAYVYIDQQKLFMGVLNHDRDQILEEPA